MSFPLILGESLVFSAAQKQLLCDLLRAPSGGLDGRALVGRHHTLSTKPEALGRCPVVLLGRLWPAESTGWGARSWQWAVGRACFQDWGAQLCLPLLSVWLWDSLRVSPVCPFLSCSVAQGRVAKNHSEFFIMKRLCDDGQTTSFSLCSLFSLSVKWRRLDVMIPKFPILRILGFFVTPASVLLWRTCVKIWLLAGGFRAVLVSWIQQACLFFTFC